MSLQAISLTEYLVVFMRTATCIMILPGFSMRQVPMRVRLFLAVAVSVSIFLLVENTISVDDNLPATELLQIVVMEFLIAFVIAIPVRFLFLALSFLGEVIMQFIGLNPIPGTPIGEDQATSTLSSLFNITAVVLFFSSGLAIEFFAAIALSFEVFPPGEVFLIDGILQNITENLTAFFHLVVRLGAPIIIYVVIMNLIAGLVNKLTPQIPIYFVSAPFLICGGLVLLAWLVDDMFFLFHMELERLIGERF